MNKLVNQILFPIPPSSYSQKSFLSEIIYVPRHEIPNKTYVPCLYLPTKNGSRKLLIFFHGNAEDLGLSYTLLNHMRDFFKVNVMAVEYPGYGIYTA